MSFCRLLDHWCVDAPDAVVASAYDIARSRSGGSLVARVELTVGALRQQAIKMATALRERGVQRGDVVALQLPNWPEFLVCHLAATYLGAVTMPISPIFRRRDVAFQVDRADAKVLVVPLEYGGFDYLAQAEAIARESDSLGLVVVVGDVDSREDTVALAELLREGSRGNLAELRGRVGAGDFVGRADDAMLISFTSGTTGEPKGVVHTQRTVIAGVRGLASALGLTQTDVFMVPVSIGHAGGFVTGVYLPFLIRARVVYLDRWSAEAAIEIAKAESITFSAMMPTHLRDMVVKSDEVPHRVPSWRLVRVSGGRIDRQLLREFTRVFPDPVVCTGWGMSEVLYGTYTSPLDASDKRLETDGRPLPGLELRVKVGDTLVARNGSGEIHIRGDSLAIGYLGAGLAPTDAPDGWFATGDLGVLDDQGYVTLTGRLKDLIIRGGENVPSLEVEMAIESHPAVAAAAVIGVPDHRLGERVCAVVELSDPAAELGLEALVTHLESIGLTRHYMPEELVITGTLPRTATGKIRKSAIQQEIVVEYVSELQHRGVS